MPYRATHRTYHLYGDKRRWRRIARFLLAHPPRVGQLNSARGRLSTTFRRLLPGPNLLFWPSHYHNHLNQKLLDNGLDEYTNLIINQTDRLTSLVDNMLGPNKKPSFKLLNIHLPIENVFTLMKREILKDKIDFKKDFDPSIPELMIDSYLLEQAILNLVRNAKEALVLSSTSSAAIQISTRILHQEFIGEIKQNTVCKISVKDNGPGIPEEIKESIFFPMISGKETGSGLGLSITQGIISQHRGTVGFNSVDGETEFFILMPIKTSGSFTKNIRNS